MSASYPAAIKTFPTRTNKVDLNDADFLNQLQDEVTALETAIGLNPKGTQADLVTRLLRNILTDGSLNHGTSFPGSPNTGDWFFKTDENVAYVYTGSTWSAQSGLTSYAAGSYLIAGPSAINTPSPSSGSPGKIVEMRIPRGGTLRIVFGLVRIPTSTANGQIYRNGSAVGTLRTNSTSTWTEYSEDISGWAAGDLLQLYVYTTGGSDSCTGGAVRIYENVPARETFGTGGAGMGNGQLWYSGNSVPPAALGNNGDLYTNPGGGASTTLYVKNGGAWTAK